MHPAVEDAPGLRRARRPLRPARGRCRLAQPRPQCFDRGHPCRCKASALRLQGSSGDLHSAASASRTERQSELPSGAGAVPGGYVRAVELIVRRRRVGRRPYQRAAVGAHSHSRRRPPESLKTLTRVGRSDRGQLDGIAGFDHHAVADDHRDMPVPHRQVAWPQPALTDGGADILLLGKPWKVQSRFVIRPLGEAAAVQPDAGCGAAPYVGNSQLRQRVPNSVGRQGVRCSAQCCRPAV